MMKVVSGWGLAWVLVASLPVWAGPDFAKEIRPILEKYCFECHGKEKQKGDLDLSRFEKLEQVQEDLELFQDVIGRVNTFEMPPKKSRQLQHDELGRLDGWFKALPKPELDCRQIASDGTQRWYRGFVMSRRLTHSEYNNAIRDLTGLDLKPARHFPADGAGGEGFDTAGNTLFSSPILMEKYLDAAEQVVQAVLPEKTDGLSVDRLAARQRVLIAEPGKDLSPRDAAHRVVSAMARRAFRRPVTKEEVDRLLTMFDRAAQRGDSYVASVRLAIKAVLISPHFLFLIEPEPEKRGVYPLGSIQLASRLSTFIWSSIPDETLLQLAEQDKLQDDKILREQIQRMMADPKSQALGEDFAMQWLELGPLGTTVKPDPKSYPEFNDALADSMKGEMVGVFHAIVRENRSLLELIDSDYTYVDERLAKHYGFEGVKGSSFQRVTLADRNRGGVVGMAAVHVVTSYPLRTSPVLRGKWVLESVLGSKVPPPPPDVPALPDKEHGKDGKSLTLRQRLELHRSKADCAACHDRMDPLGFGLENFDVLGRWRSTFEGDPIDASGVLPSGERFAGPTELKAIMMKQRDRILRHLSKKMLGYALGRDLNKFDNCVLDDAMKAMGSSEHRAAALIETIAMSYPFRHRFAKK